jgi:hypothetical protein
MTQFNGDNTPITLYNGHETTAEEYVGLVFEEWSYKHRGGDIAALLIFIAALRSVALSVSLSLSLCLSLSHSLSVSLSHSLCLSLSHSLSLCHRFSTYLSLKYLRHQKR